MIIPIYLEATDNNNDTVSLTFAVKVRSLSQAHTKAERVAFYYNRGLNLKYIKASVPNDDAPMRFYLDHLVSVSYKGIYGSILYTKHVGNMSEYIREHKTLNITI